MTYDIYISAHQFYHVFFFFFLRGAGELAYSLRRGLFKKDEMPDMPEEGRRLR